MHHNAKKMEQLAPLLQDGQIKISAQFVGTGLALAFETGKEYNVMSIEKGWIRVMTELDEDYLFPPELFRLTVSILNDTP